MKAVITGENDERVGVNIRDTNDAEHVIEMEFDGKIQHHQCDAYHDDPSNRTPEENEHNEQARRYARYYVFRERGYPTVEPRNVPEWVAVGAMALARLSPGEFESHFGAYHRQFRSTVEADVAPVVEVPESAVAGLRVVRQNVHLDLPLAAVLDEGDELADLEAGLQSDPDPDPDPVTVARELDLHLEAAGIDPTAITVGGTSDVGVLYQGHDEDVVIEAADPHPGPADARLELSPVEAPWEEYLPTDAFQFLLVYHLLCQVRDCYLGMGLEPPAGVRILGMGQYRQTVRNQHLDMYDPVHFTDADVPGYRLPDVAPPGTP